MLKALRITWSIGNLWVPSKREYSIKTLTDIGRPVVKPLFRACRNSYTKSNAGDFWASVRRIFAEVKAGEQLAALLRTCQDDVGKTLLCQQLGYLADPDTADALIEALTDQSCEVRWHAAQALGLLGNARAVPPLIGALTDKDLHVRRDAAVSLGRLRDRRAVEPLVNMLNAGDEQSDVPDSVAWALGSLGDPLAVEPLVEKLKTSSDNKRFCRAALTALGLLRASSARSDFIKGLRDRETCGAAAKALGRLGDVSVLEPLLAEWKVAENDPVFLPKWSMTDAISLGEALFALSPDQALPIIIEALGSSSSLFATTAICVLRHLVDEDHLPLDVLLAAGECRSSGVRDGIASVLRGVDNPGAPAALEALKKVKPGLLVVILPKDCDVPAMVKQVAKELAFQNGPCQVRHGPVQMTRGVAEAILAQIDMKEGTSYLSRHFEVGTGMALKTEFGYILCP